MRAKRAPRHVRAPLAAYAARPNHPPFPQARTLTWKLQGALGGLKANVKRPSEGGKENSPRKLPRP